MKNSFFIFNNKNNTKCDYYGGDQDWYSSNSRAMAGCSSVAGANALRALCHTDKNSFNTILENKKMPAPVKRALLSSRCLKEDFLMLQTFVYEIMKAFEIFPLNIIYDHKDRNNKFFRYVKPNNGRSSIGFISGLLRCARKLNLFLKYHALPTAFCTKEEAVNFIKEGLKASGSIVLLTSYNKHHLKAFFPSVFHKQETDTIPFDLGHCCYETYMKCHFATITGIQDDKLIISTWGKVAYVHVDEIVRSWQSIKAWESSLFYFTLADKAQTRKDIFTSWIPFVVGIKQALLRRR